MLQRFIKRVTEREVFVPIIVQAGFDSKKADCLLHWGLPERSQIPLLMLFVWLMFRLKVVCSLCGLEEVRRMLVKMGFDLTVEE